MIRILINTYLNYQASHCGITYVCGLTLAIMGRLPWKRVPGYWIAQYLAAFVSSAVVFGVYYGKYLHLQFVFLNTCNFLSILSYDHVILRKPHI